MNNVVKLLGPQRETARAMQAEQQYPHLLASSTSTSSFIVHTLSVNQDTLDTLLEDTLYIIDKWPFAAASGSHKRRCSPFRHHHFLFDYISS